MTGTCRLHCDRSGNPKAPVILFVHGFMGSTLDWAKIVESLSPDYYCLAVDLPGHGQTGIWKDPHAYTMEGTAHALAQAMDEAGITRCALVGYSMGGRLALHMAIHYPERCSQLVLESASPGIQGVPERDERRTLDETRAQQLEQEDFESFLRSWYNQPLFESLKQDPPLLQEILIRRRNNDPGELARSIRGMSPGAQSSEWHELPQLRIPLLMVVGGKDLRYNSIARKMVELAPKARLAIVADAGHNVHAENPNAYVETVRKFLSRQE